AVEFGLETFRRRQAGECLARLALGRERLVAARRQPDFRLGECREPGADAALLALGRRVAVARGIGLGLRLAPARAGFRLRGNPAGGTTYLVNGSPPSGSVGSAASSRAPAQRIGAAGSIGASRSSPSAAPSAAS